MILMGGSFDAGGPINGKTVYREVGDPMVRLTRYGRVAVTLGGVCLLMDHEHSRQFVEALMAVTLCEGEPLLDRVTGQVAQRALGGVNG